MSRSIEALSLSIDKEKILNKHRNYHRLLKSYPVVNPFVDSLELKDSRLEARRNFPKYLTLIDSICLMRQFQKKVKAIQDIEYLEVDQTDIDLASRLFGHVIENSTSELNSHTRELLMLIKDRFSEDSFSRKDIRELTFWSFSKVQRCMTELLKHELVTLETGGIGKVHEYRLVQTCSNSPEQVNPLIQKDLSEAVQ